MVKKIDEMSFDIYLSKLHTPQTKSLYIRLINRYLIEYSSPELTTHKEIISYLFKLKKQQLTSLSALKKYYDFLIFIGIIDHHPCKYLSLRKKSPPIQPQNFFSTSELENLLERPCRYAILENRNKSILSFLIYHGLTSENIVRLRTKDVSLSEGTVYISNSTKANRRLLFLEAKQIIYLIKYIEIDRPKLNLLNNERLFLGKKGEPLLVSAIFSIVETMKKLFPDRSLNPKTIRQSVVSNLANDNRLSLVKIQEITGHKRLSSIEKYRSEDMSEQRRIINLFHPMNHF
jgi:site-specific recombinase XerD